MNYYGANCDIYIGKGAGKQLVGDIRRAKKSVKIVSPYLSPLLISELIDLKKRNIEVELITSDKIEDFNGNREKNIHQLIIQNRKTDQKAVIQREKWKYIAKMLVYIEIELIILISLLAVFLKDIRVAYGLVPIIIVWILIRFYRQKVRKKRIYIYSYSQLFPFKVFFSPYATHQSDTFIHSKIYVIDDQIAYMGSLNFTSSGTIKNYETRVRTTDAALIREINNEFYQLMYFSSLPERDIQAWGRQLYAEPLN